MAGNIYAKDLQTLAGLLSTDKAAIEVYIANFATPQTLEAMRFWVQGELNRVQKGFTSTDTVVKLIATVVRNIINGIGEINPETGVATADHSLLSNLDLANQHPMTVITGLNSDQQRQDQNLANLEATLGNLVYSGYGGMRQTVPAALPDIGAGWVTLVADESEVTTPRNITENFTNNSLTPGAFGVWQITIVVNLDHNEVTNTTRMFNVRAFNLTKGWMIGRELHVGVPKNIDTTNLAFTALTEVDPAGTYASVGDEIVIQVGGTTDNFTSVVENTFVYSANMVSEYIVP